MALTYLSIVQTLAGDNRNQWISKGLFNVVMFIMAVITDPVPYHTLLLLLRAYHVCWFLLLCILFSTLTASKLLSRRRSFV